MLSSWPAVLAQQSWLRKACCLGPAVQEGVQTSFPMGGSQGWLAGRSGSKYFQQLLLETQNDLTVGWSFKKVKLHVVGSL